MGIKHELRRILRKSGFDVCRYTPDLHPLARRMQLLKSNDIDLVIDVGANAGQFAQELRRELDYSGRIISFEPLSEAFKLLKIRSETDDAWEAFNFALGDVEGLSDINIAGNSYSSSMLEMLSSHESFAPESRYQGKEKIEVKKLDSIFRDMADSDNRVYLKIDTQGYEKNVLLGAEESLSYINFIQMEMSLIPLYQEEKLFSDLHEHMTSRAYELVAIEPGFTDRNSGRLLQVDGIYINTKLI